jgi:catechol 2,3-dioxygenase-like lactoylglutathione lyase family enzyme
MIKPNNTNSEFALGGIDHVALVCADMAKTVDFYSNMLGMLLVKVAGPAQWHGSAFLLRRRQRHR